MPAKPARASAALAAVILFSAGATLPARADDAPVPEQIVNEMNKLWGQHPGFRANHAKGIFVEGSFTPAASASALSKAVLFKGPAVPFIGRFSDATGLPKLPDGSGEANPHGVAFKFQLPGGGDMDLVVNSLKFFPVATGEEFRDLLHAAAASKDAPKPTPVEKFLEAHPQAAKALGSTATPTSFVREIYRGIDAFIFVDAAGKRQAFRYVLTPEAGAEHLSKEEAAKQAPDFLMDELKTRLGQGPARYKLAAQLANPEDSTKDATIPWPDDRKVVELGTITFTKVVPESDQTKALVFFPENIPDGIEVSDDPLLDVRNQAYAVSFSRRMQ